VHAQKRLFMNFRCKFRHRRSIRRPQFPVTVQNFGDLATFSVDYCILHAECPPYFYFRFVWATDLEGIPHASTPTSIIPTRFEVDMIIHCRVIAFLSADTSRDLVNLTFDPEQMSYMASHVTNLATKYEDHTPIRSSVMSDNVSVGYHSKCVRGQCACTESHDPWVRGQKRLHLWNPRSRFAYSLSNFYWATTTIKGRLLSSNTNAKAFDCVNFLCVTVWPWPLTV